MTEDRAVSVNVGFKPEAYATRPKGSYYAWVVGNTPIKVLRLSVQ